MAFYKFLLIIAATLQISSAYSQSNNVITEIPLEQVGNGDNVVIEEDTNPERDVELFSILPVLTFDSGLDGISIISSDVTFENVEYEICDAEGTTYVCGMLSLNRGEEEFISTELLPNGTCTIYLNIGDNIYYGTFTK